jgi:hypothetical protein
LLHDSPISKYIWQNLPTNHVKWSYYNQYLIRRGEILLGFNVIGKWIAELKEMSKDKVVFGTI